MNTPLNVLLIEEHSNGVYSAIAAAPHREDSGFLCEQVPSLTQAVQALQQKRYDVALLDLDLPDSRGLETIQKLMRAAPSLPVLILARPEDEALAAKALLEGAQDYLFKTECDAKLFSHAIRYVIERKKAEDQMRLAAKVFDNTAEGIFITDADGLIISINKAFTTITDYTPEEVQGESILLFQSEHHDEKFFKALWESLSVTGQWQGEIWNRRRNSEVYPERLTISTVKDEHGQVVNYIGIFTDVTSRKQAEERLRYLATHDPLTDLPNRDLFADRLNHALARAHRNRNANAAKWMTAVMLIDLDHFKNINDTLGHDKGDLVLQVVAERLKRCIRQSDTVARMGGDEFTLVLEGLAAPQDSLVIAQKILIALARPLVLDGREYFVSGSIGISLYPQHGEDAGTLLKNADIAMYRAKKERNCFRVYQEWEPEGEQPPDYSSTRRG